MLKVTGITQGIVIDHITSGNGLKIFNKLKLDKIDAPVVLLMKVNSHILGKKDIIKIQDHVNIDMTILGLIDQNATVNIIKNGEITSKSKVEIPKKIKGLFQCKNPRCITTVDDYAISEFTLVPNGKVQYRCNYCEELTEYKL
ncbi:aspartate carbamoyltransferase regulatory subunit [Alkaliphilus sp. B6464]|uniref:aspartate carbamoyltransferase regulatory subunit n=1 Tax=Alkaliphilus sp. B6464 TaxID=2731219 RepID=UPI001BA9B1D9|nr:aspartate carbamoyltransferase regulatory subunit [Alkaliphilus sp. B6464]QUH20050.1 aspartate carbamoyltransferase regulatory subunit [Alkaliphilus sp. B6464]